MLPGFSYGRLFGSPQCYDVEMTERPKKDAPIFSGSYITTGAATVNHPGIYRTASYYSDVKGLADSSTCAPSAMTRELLGRRYPGRHIYINLILLNIGE